MNEPCVPVSVGILHEREYLTSSCHDMRRSDKVFCLVCGDILSLKCLNEKMHVVI